MAGLWRAFPTYYVTVRKCGMISANRYLTEKWDEVIKNHKEFFVKNYENVLQSMSMEELRQVDLNVDDQAGFGVDGTFKKLQID
jgi:hypothetical protein